jgi:hypothetical protein
LEGKFALKALEKKKEEAVTVEKEGKEKLLSVLDPKKSNAISFMMAKLPPMQVLKEGLYLPYCSSRTNRLLPSNRDNG